MPHALTTLAASALVIISTLWTGAHAASPQATTDCTVALPGKEIDWLPQELWAWNQICAGKVADLAAARYTEGAADNSRGIGVHDVGASPDGCREARVLRPAFLDAVLFREPTASAVPRQGVRIAGACFTEDLDLDGGVTHHSLALTSSHIPGLNLTNARIEGDVRLTGSSIAGLLKLEGVKIDGVLAVDSGAKVANVNLYGAKVGGNVIMRGATVTSVVNLDHSEIGGGFLASDNAQFARIDAFGTNIASDLDLHGSSVLGLLVLSNAKIDGNLILGDGAAIRAVDMRSSRVGGTVDLRGAHVEHEVAIESSRIDEDVLLGRRAEILRLRLLYDLVTGSVEIGSGSYGAINLAGTKIAQDLRFGSPTAGTPEFSASGTVTLLNVSTGTIQDGIAIPEGADCRDDRSNPWPRHLVLDGLSYQRLAPSQERPGANMAERPEAWLTCWLELQAVYSPQPYDQLAATLTTMGYREKAAAILYASNERALATEPRWEKRLILWLDKALIGYGYRPYRAIGWVGFLVLVGALMLVVDSQYKKIAAIDQEPSRWSVAFDCVGYSFDMLLPIIRLRERHYGVDLDGPARYYFYAHKIMGYVLAGFVAASTASLVK